MSATDHASTASSATTLVEATGFRMTYGATTALDGLDMTLAPGQIVGLLGENGCGKTTLLKILAGVLAGYSGDVRIAGHVPGPESKALVSYLPDTSFLPDAARVSYCLELYTDFFADFQPEKARDLIGFFGLSESARLKQMSKGMREKVQIALAMSRDARVFLLDEPISGVDPAARQVILDAAVMMRHGRVLLSGDADDLRGSRGASLDQIFRETYR